MKWGVRGCSNHFLPLQCSYRRISVSLREVFKHLTSISYEEISLQYLKIKYFLMGNKKRCSNCGQTTITLFLTLKTTYYLGFCACEYFLFVFPLTSGASYHLYGVQQGVWWRASALTGKNKPLIRKWREALITRTLGLTQLCSHWNTSPKAQDVKYPIEGLHTGAYPFPTKLYWRGNYQKNASFRVTTVSAYLIQLYSL